MKKELIFICSAALIFGCIATGSVSALDFGNDITIDDGNTGTGSWYTGEDNEVEPGMQTGQKWDLEGFFQQGSLLTMIGGYDFINGEDGSGHWDSGDIFIDVDGGAEYGDIHNSTISGGKTVNDTFGYDYVLDMDFESLTYNIYELTATSRTITAHFTQNQGSSPWRYESGGTLIGEEKGYAFEYKTDLTKEQTGFDGESHNAVIVDLSFLDTQVTGPTVFTTHFTMECGNDNLMGEGFYEPVPEPSTMLLLGCGLLGILGVSRQRLKK